MFGLFGFYPRQIIVSEGEFQLVKVDCIVHLFPPIGSGAKRLWCLQPPPKHQSAAWRRQGHLECPSVGPFLQHSPVKIGKHFVKRQAPVATAEKNCAGGALRAWW